MAYVMVPCAICGRSIPLLDSRDMEQVCTTCVRWIMRYDSFLKWGVHSDQFWCDLGSESHYGVYRQEIEVLGEVN